MCFLCHTKEKCDLQHCLWRQIYRDNDEKFTMYLNCIENLPPIWKVMESLALSATCVILTSSSLLSWRFSWWSFFFSFSFFILVRDLNLLMTSFYYFYLFQNYSGFEQGSLKIAYLIWNILASCRNMKCMPEKMRQENPKFKTSLGSIVISRPVWAVYQIIHFISKNPTARV